jgi:hypothetical protein
MVDCAGILHSNLARHGNFFSNPNRPVKWKMNLSMADPSDEIYQEALALTQGPPAQVVERGEKPKLLSVQ